MTKKGIVAGTEVLGVKLTEKLSNSDKSEFVADPRAFVHKTMNVDLGDDVTINAVQNSEAVVHIALPYYLENRNPPEGLSEEEMANASGGVNITADSTGLTEHEIAVCRATPNGVGFANKTEMHNAVYNAYHASHPDRYDEEYRTNDAGQK